MRLSWSKASSHTLHPRPRTSRSEQGFLLIYGIRMACRRQFPNSPQLVLVLAKIKYGKLTDTCRILRTWTRIGHAEALAPNRGTCNATATPYQEPVPQATGGKLSATAAASMDRQARDAARNRQQNSSHADWTLSGLCLPLVAGMRRNRLGPRHYQHPLANIPRANAHANAHAMPSGCYRRCYATVAAFRISRRLTLLGTALGHAGAKRAPLLA